MNNPVLLWYGIDDPIIVLAMRDAQSNERFAEHDGVVMRLCPRGEIDVIHNPDAAQVPLAWCGR